MESFTDIWQYMPHGMCLLWQPWLVVLWAGSDLLIFLSYMAIPLALLIVLKKRKEVPHSGLLALFAAFILLCGLTHFFSIVTLWYPIYPYVGFVKLATGIVSALTAVVLFRLVPTLIAFPSPRELELANRNLREEAAAHDASLVKLREARDGLEEKVAERTRELEEANAMLAVVTREAIHRSGNLLSVVNSLASQTARGADSVEDYIASFQGRLAALAEGTASVLRGQNATSGSLGEILQARLAPLGRSVGEGATLEGPDIRITSEAAQQISLVAHELATNALKYNSHGQTPPPIRIEWGLEGKGDEQSFVLTWSEVLGDDQAENFAAQKRVGFGSKLLTRVIPIVLNGEAERTFVDGRFTYRLRAPASSVVAPKRGDKRAALAARIVDENFGAD